MVIDALVVRVSDLEALRKKEELVVQLGGFVIFV